MEAANEGDNVNFINSGVVNGDFFRTQYTTNNQNVVEWTDYEIEGVVSETTLVLKSGPSSPISVAEKFTIYRNLDADGQVEELNVVSESVKDRRATMMYPDYITDDDDYVVPGYYIACAIAGMVAGTPPHQGLTNYTVDGFKDAPRSYVDMTQADLDNLANGGWMILTQDTKDGAVYVRHQLTTNVDYLEYRELSIGVNVDNISFFLKAILDPMIGIYNINDDTLDLIRTNLEAGIEDLKSVEDTQAGPQLIDARVIELYQDPTFKDQVRTDILLTIPYPLNVINVHLII